MKGLAEGSVVEIDADAAAGHEQSGRRPAVVVSVPDLHESGFAVVCPLTTHGGTASRPRNALEVLVPSGLPVAGVILTYHLRTVDLKARNAKVIATVPRATLLAVRSRLKVMLGL